MDSTSSLRTSIVTVGRKKAVNLRNIVNYSLCAMVDGPPTPPPTSAAEIQDEERAQAQLLTQLSSEPPAQSSPQPSTSDSSPVPPPATPEAPSQAPLNIYPLVLPSLVDLASQGNFQELIAQAENADINVLPRSPIHTHHVHPHLRQIMMSTKLAYFSQRH